MELRSPIRICGAVNKTGNTAENPRLREEAGVFCENFENRATLCMMTYYSRNRKTSDRIDQKIEQTQEKANQRAEIDDGFQFGFHGRKYQKF